MKKALLTIVLCLSSSGAFAQGIQHQQMSVLRCYNAAAEASYTYCSTCPDAAAGADVLCEDFEPGDADGLCTWTLVEPGDGTGDIDLGGACDNSPALGCTNILMTDCLVFTKTDAGSSTVYAHKSLGGTLTATYIQFYVKILAESIGDGEYYKLFATTGSDVTFESGVSIQLYQTSSNLYFVRTYKDGSDVHDVGGTIIALDTWYGIRVHIVNPTGDGSDSVQWWVDYNLDGTFTDEGLAETLGLDTTQQNVRWGFGSANADTITFHATGLKVDDDTMPGDCSR